MLKRSSIALALSSAFAATSLFAAPQIEVIAQIVWQPNADNFGGLSALEVDNAGEGFITVSDTGVLYRGTLKRDVDGLLNGASLSNIEPLRFEGGQRPALKQDRDTEGLATSSAKDLYIAAEFNPRLLRYRKGQRTPQIGKLPLRGDQVPSNMGFEALALSPRNTLVAIPEGSENIRASFPVFERNATNGLWSVIYDLPRHGGFRPVGADFDENGHLYILSRGFNGFGFSTRIDRLLFEDGVPSAYQPLFQSRFRQFDNLEGLAVWHAAPDDLRLYAISDDNFRSAQQTEIIEFRLKE
ncbi:esterase-like activity of phytase family protein [Planktotalea sp.]|uniref:esterase-like activity of phytase family protein n=1 Tax=Planktotalea sp. TaxID=2029877 RepID=UPI00329A333A